MRPIVLALAASALVAIPTPAEACSRVGNGSWQADAAQAGDTTPPSATVVSAFVTRDKGDSGGCLGTSSCGSFAAIHLDVQATDDRTSPEEIAFEVRVVGGTAPTNFDPSRDGRVLPAFGTELIFNFQFSSPSFAVDLEVRAVDANGNLGPPVVITVEDTVDEGGCAISRQEPSGTGNLVGFGLLAFATAFALRRHR
jgi:hypothetical protein